jgi:hypothetical protein
VEHVVTTHFHRNPLGRGRLAVFLRCSLDPYESDRGARSRLEKQPTGPGKMHAISGTGH